MIISFADTPHFSPSVLEESVSPCAKGDNKKTTQIRIKGSSYPFNTDDIKDPGSRNHISLKSLLSTQLTHRRLTIIVYQSTFAYKNLLSMFSVESSTFSRPISSIVEVVVQKT
ncbi:hypothetical protein L6452_43301 [Arctium lappa]|uniref:Uncharacterized protein n=1 Tax=Arctium lappa TaxID=4217 RepID=A0ACB8XKN4_ARCLA|nr:hypothetical protein L6452_43301 [Arctium lappa]